MILLLLGCLAPKHIGTIDVIDNGLCVVEFDNHFHIYVRAVCNGRIEGETIKIK